MNSRHLTQSPRWRRRAERRTLAKVVRAVSRTRTVKCQIQRAPLRRGFFFVRQGYRPYTEKMLHVIHLRRDLGLGVLAIIAVATTSALGQLATYPNLTPWYAGLVKPSFNPPNWIFGPVWTTQYVLMAFAAWRILRLPQPSADRRLALSLFFIQLVLNAAWSWMFFGANSLVLGVINIIPQLAIIFAMVIAFYRLDKLAGWCLLPLLAWVSFACVLNVTIWRLNV